MAQTEAVHKFTEHKIVLENRKKITLTGVERVLTAIPTQFCCTINQQKLCITGKNLEVNQLNVESGCVCLTGEILGISYLGEKKSLLRRVFG